MFGTVENISKVPELRKKIFYTLALIAVFRLGCFIPIPGINTVALESYIDNMVKGSTGTGTVFTMLNMFAGGAFKKGTIFGLGIMPYISASIIFQLMISIFPALEKIAKEGEAGRKKISQYTKYATIGICMFQAALVVNYLCSINLQGGQTLVQNPGFVFKVVGIVTITTGTAFLIWLGDKITEHGIGNGISLIIMAGILSRMPIAIQTLAQKTSLNLQDSAGKMGLLNIGILIFLFAFMIVSVVLITLGQRRIPVQQAKQTRGRRVYGGQKTYLPLRVNQAGVIPIIFASSLLMIPSMLSKAPGIGFVFQAFAFGSTLYVVSFILLILFFSFFYTAIQFNPIEMSKNMKEGGTFIPGIRPGRKTADYLEKVMTRVTFAGACFLAFVAVIPTFIRDAFDIHWTIASLFGGTGLLISVGVSLDLVQKIESYLLTRDYDGFIRRGKQY